jgi:arylsulfatase
MSAPNVALVVLDTLRYDRFEEYFGWLPGVRFENAFSTSHWTVPAHASLFTGRYASETGIFAKSRQLDCDKQVLAEVLSENGYNTYSLTANPNVSQQEGWDRGFDEVRGPSQLQYPPRNKNVLDWDLELGETEASGYRLYLEMVRRCVSKECSTINSLWHGANLAFRKDSLAVEDSGASSVLSWLQTNEISSPSFTFINLMEAHTPYDPPSSYSPEDEAVSISVDDVFTGVENPKRVRRAYDDAVQYLSDKYREIFKELSEVFDYVITLSDHGEFLGEDGRWNHVYGLNPELVKIPLVISGNKIRNERRPEVVNLHDVYATILACAGVENTNRGVNLLEAEIPKRRLLTEYHGLMSGASEKIRQAGVSDEEISEIEKWKRGIVFNSEGYGYESREGFVSIGSSPDDPEAVLETIVSDLDVVSEDEIRPSRKIKSHLRDLGYA